MKLKPGCQNWCTIQNQSQICDISVGEGDDDRAIFSVRARFEPPVVVGMVVSV
jgi:hypothetical protein